MMTMSVHAEIEISAQVIEFRMKRRERANPPVRGLTGGF
jgi:hypothetical protein